MIGRRFITIAMIAATYGGGSAAADERPVAVLQGLDKVTARVSTIQAPVGDVVRFGALEIIARICDKKPPEETPESAAFLDIWEVRPGEPTISLFRGWMFASSPALSAMEHPVYDVWVLDCADPPAPAAILQAIPAATPEAPAETTPPPANEPAPAPKQQ
jgi:hypothetical protein